MIRIFEGLDQSSPRYGTLGEREKLAMSMACNASPEVKEKAISALKSGTLDIPEALLADCPICGHRLGVVDRYLNDFVWLNGSEHYVEAHNLYPTALIQLLQAEGIFL